jgi:hypothetical protein
MAAFAKNWRRQLVQYRDTARDEVRGRAGRRQIPITSEHSRAGGRRLLRLPSSLPSAGVRSPTATASKVPLLLWLRPRRLKRAVAQRARGGLSEPEQSVEAHPQRRFSFGASADFGGEGAFDVVEFGLGEAAKFFEGTIEASPEYAALLEGVFVVLAETEDVEGTFVFMADDFSVAD